MKNYVTQQDIDQYELLSPLLTAAYGEVQELSKKKPESPLNTYKVKAINRVIVPIKELLKDESVFNYLDILEIDDLPTNSDVVLILSQYKKALSMFYDTYCSYDGFAGGSVWSIEPEPVTTTVQTRKKKEK